MHLMPLGASDKARIVGIDPGSSTLGFCCIEFSAVTVDIYQTNAQTFTGNKLSQSAWVSNIHGDRFSRIQAHQNNILSLLQFINPVAVICESPFYNSRMPQAFGALTEVVTAIRQAVFDYDPYIVLDLVDPPTAKKAVGAMGNAGKDDVKAAVLKLKDLNYSGSVPLQMLDEHSIDAIAIAYSKINQYRQYLNEINLKDPPWKY